MNNNDKFVSRKSRSRSRQKARRRNTNLLLSIGCCLVLIAMVIGVSKFIIPSDTNKQYNKPLSNSESRGGGRSDKSSNNLILVNQQNYIPDDYEVDLIELSNGQLVDKQIYSSLQEMFNTARNENIYPIVRSGYRTTEKQQQIMDEKIAELKAQGLSTQEAKKKAEKWVAVPGTSEHQLGLGVDINADGVHSTGEQVYEWLDKNAHKFGFIRRYPEDKIDITGVNHEPWHYRYVGIKAATEMHEQGICLEEYLD